MHTISSIGQAVPHPPPHISDGGCNSVHLLGQQPPVIDPFLRPSIDPFVLPVIDPFVLPVVEPFVVPSVRPYMPYYPTPAPHHTPHGHVPIPYRPATRGPHWAFYVLLALVAHYALVEKEF